MNKSSDHVVWFTPAKNGSGCRVEKGVVLVVSSTKDKKRGSRTRLTIYSKLMKHGRLISGDKIAFGVSDDFYIIARNNAGYKLSPTGGKKTVNSSHGISVAHSITAREEYTMQDVEIREDGSILILRKKAATAVNE